jgi:hypothetical protein
MTDIVAERKRLGQILIEGEGTSDCPGDLTDFDGMGEAVAEVVRKARRENLSLILEAAEGAGVHEAVTVALELGAVGVRGLRIASQTTLAGREAEPAEGGEHAGGYC